MRKTKSKCPTCGASRKLVLVATDDWEGLYEDGKLLTEGHSIDVDQFASHAGIELDTIWAEVYFDGYNRSSCPENLSEVMEVLEALKGKQ